MKDPITPDDESTRPPKPDLHAGPRTPEEYFTESREWLEVAEWETIENNAYDRSTNLAMLAIASALLGICAQFMRDQEAG